MENNLGESPTYSDMMYALLGGIKKSMAMKKFKETNEVLVSLGYSKEEIKDILKGIINQVSCS